MTTTQAERAAAKERSVAIENRIREACRRSGRDRSEVSLIAVSKRQPVAKIALALATGLTVLGESQVQEAVAKSAELPLGLDWQLIGHLQSNKVAAAVGLFSTIHSLDRPKIVERVDREARKQGRVMSGFLQVNLGAEASKHGFSTQDFVDSVTPWARLRHLNIVGLMAIPPYEADGKRARSWFRMLRALRDRLRKQPAWHDRASSTGTGEMAFGALSMGMSHDFEVAIEEGATHIRVGTGLFGPRPSQ